MALHFRMYDNNENGIKCFASGISSNPNGCKKCLMFTHIIEDAMSFLTRFKFSFHERNAARTQNPLKLSSSSQTALLCN
jgi:hypothetical protein